MNEFVKSYYSKLNIESEECKLYKDLFSCLEKDIFYAHRYLRIIDKIEATGMFRPRKFIINLIKCKLHNIDSLKDQIGFICPDMENINGNCLCKLYSNLLEQADILRKYLNEFK